jgi:hypothetical protein
MRHESRLQCAQGFNTLAKSALAAAVATAIFAAAASAQTIPSLNSTTQSRAAGPYTPVPQQPLFNDGSHRIIVSNDLGMHCGNFDSRIVSILPPFNVLHAQVLATGASPTLLDDKTVSVVYSAAANAKDPALTKVPVVAADDSIFKSNFWDRVSAYEPFYPPGLFAQFFAATPAPADIGLPVPDVAQFYLGSGKLSARRPPLILMMHVSNL